LHLASTQTKLPEPYYGEELAIGYSALTREGSREKVNLFQANGITPAAGFSSNVIDLGKFASWQFRLIDTTTAEILKPNTLKNMYNVHWTDPDFETTWGLGFAVYKGSDGKKWVSHGGSCPGYRSTLQINPETKMAYSVMINASGTSPGKYASGIKAILNKVSNENPEEKDVETDPIDLKQYTGYYSSLPWWSEIYIAKWGDQLVGLSLPSDDPTDAMTFFKHIEGDTFKRVRDNGELGEAVVFERDQDGNIIRFKRHGNYVHKIISRE
jgi:CubicO group peptidase (beta-lactamase class C family)